MNFYRGKLRGSRFKFLLVRLSCSDEVLDFECNNRRAELDCLGCVAFIRVKFYKICKNFRKLRVWNRGRDIQISHVMRIYLKLNFRNREIPKCLQLSCKRREISKMEKTEAFSLELNVIKVNFYFLFAFFTLSYSRTHLFLVLIEIIPYLSPSLLYSYLVIHII